MVVDRRGTALILTAAMSARRRLGHLGSLFLTAAIPAFLATPAFAQASPVTAEPEMGARKMFLMLRPIKILLPFVDITQGADPAFRRTLARRAILISAAALALAGLLGRTMLENFEISCRSSP
jgi:multiple antibiotic resistance protein